MEFFVKLIKTSKTNQDIEGNCTHVFGNIWLFEGEIDCLTDDDSVKVDVIDEGVVGCLGDMGQKELIELCKDTFVCGDIFVEAEVVNY